MIYVLVSQYAACQLLDQRLACRHGGFLAAPLIFYVFFFFLAFLYQNVFFCISLRLVRFIYFIISLLIILSILLVECVYYKPENASNDLLTGLLFQYGGGNCEGVYLCMLKAPDLAILELEIK